MSELLQSGQFPGASGHHPDADQLSAFMEQALPAHEREQVLAHLAVCPDCRETVALSLPQLEATPTPAPVRRPWFSGWPVFAPAALALAASVFFVVHLRHANTGISTPEPPAQIAISQPPTAIVPPTKPYAPSAATSASRTRAANRAAPAPPASHIERRQLDELAVAPQASPPPPAAMAGEAMKSAAIPAQGGVNGFISAAPAPAPPAVAPSTPSANAPISSGAQTIAAASEPPLLDTASTSRELRLALPAAQPVVFKNPLPSGLAALSVATNGHALLAIDAYNAVFLSNDSGEHWVAVPATWQGRAVNVNLVPHNAAHASATAAPLGGRVTTFANAALLPAPMNASLTGVVTDASGAVIPGATVTIRNAATSAERTVTTDGNGRYLAEGFAPGSYTIEAKASGFMPQRVESVAVDASRQTAKNLTLQAGSVSQSVTVQAEAEPDASLSATKSKTLKSPPVAAVPPQAIFEIVTDTGEHWTSTDGVAWQRR